MSLGGKGKAREEEMLGLELSSKVGLFGRPSEKGREIWGTTWGHT